MGAGERREARGLAAVFGQVAGVRGSERSGPHSGGRGPRLGGGDFGGRAQPFPRAPLLGRVRRPRPTPATPTYF